MMNELHLDTVTAAQSCSGQVLRGGFLLPSQGVLPQLSVEPSAARLVYVC